MNREVAEACLRLLQTANIPTLDITGAPRNESPFSLASYRSERTGKAGHDRQFLTILVAPGFADLPEFLAENSVEVVASLPCYLEEKCRQTAGRPCV